MTPEDPIAVAGQWTATDLVEVTDDPAALERTGRWMVAISFEGRAILARFATWEHRRPHAEEVGSWVGPDPDSWTTSLDEDAYIAAVEAVRAHISRGEVYQANICRVLRTPLAPESDIVGLHARLVAGNPAPHAGALRLPEHGIHIASASPELYLRRSGQHVVSRPIKGTGVRATDLLAKDEAENVMIVDLVRNDLGRVCSTGSVTVPGLLEREAHPGLVHLVSTVAGDLRPGTTWPQILAATFPPGSVTGAPKLAALDIIRAQERGPRGTYCGAFGWVDADTGTAELAVAIRTFWREDGMTGPTLCFGTGAGITWDSDARAEWRETKLKAARLLAVAGDREVL
ncbi:MAG TPA: anthranilate synthase component I family protein [Candidatus Limnocylindrales bacterium]|nr:anthranilate synthase component I family protein [Candidatus Limnocylindrales bacterium]